ncbi:GAF and ANTAR domain-containing protein [Pseudonocardia sp. CA-107938]|uniref:GAF and ANTAR domain-containing protein n=1 Tax=Pseudonocardia sp. CA-107938 TaxID=3240021 RepID=UPI003D8A967C
MADVARDLLDQPTHRATLDRVVAHAAELVDGCVAASVMVLSGDGVRTLAATDELAVAADHAQGETHEGPCLDAMRKREQVYRLDDTRDRSVWPDLAQRVEGLGVGAVLGFLLHATDRDNLGALNLYATTPGAFTEQSERAGWIVASHCAIAVATARRDEAMQLALHNSRRIGLAVGVLMCRQNLTEQAAFTRMSRFSQDHNVKVRDIAEQVIRIGDLPRRR